VQGSNNSLRWNETSGNGYSTGTIPNFGIGLSGATSTNNLIEANTAIGNANGIIVFPPATNNEIRQNVVVGNPSIQVTNSLPAAPGVDIWDQSAASNGNHFFGNLCVTAINAPCPNVSTQAIPRKPAR